METTGTARESFRETSTLMWKPLRVLHVYRLILAVLLFALFATDTGPRALGTQAPALFLLASVTYVLVALFSSITNQQQRSASFLALHLPLLADIGAITVMMHASGGITSGLGVLLLVSVAGASLLLSERLALWYAAAASLMVLGEQFLRKLYGMDPALDFTQAGTLGMALFAVAFTTHAMGARARESEALAVQRGVDIANLEQVNAYIIEQSEPGIVVLDDRDHIRLHNSAARDLLALGPTNDPSLVFSAPGQLKEALQRWRSAPGVDPEPFRNEATGKELLPRYVLLGDQHENGTLVFLEDNARATRRSHEMRLAALGRLTSTIAHEIRNPLSAINHAAQLLGESSNLDAAEQRFIEIIRNHSRRLDNIVENVLHVARRNPSNPRALDLRAWLEKFISEFGLCQNDLRVRFELAPIASNLMVRVDPVHLHQILFNICTNAGQHAGNGVEPVCVHLHAGYSREGAEVVLSIQDSGPGIPREVTREMFEPFFTTSDDGVGVGLGLYIARDLGELNGGRLEYTHGNTGGAFRLYLRTPARETAAA